MSAYAELRAKQKARSHIVGADGAMRKIAPLHRATVVDLPEDCAEEGCQQFLNDWRNNQGDPILKAPMPSKAERTEVAKFWRVAACFGIAVGSVLLLVHWRVSK